MVDPRRKLLSYLGAVALACTPPPRQFAEWRGSDDEADATADGNKEGKSGVEDGTRDESGLSADPEGGSLASDTGQRDASVPLGPTEQTTDAPAGTSTGSGETSLDETGGGGSPSAEPATGPSSGASGGTDVSGMGGSPAPADPGSTCEPECPVSAQCVAGFFCECLVPSRTYCAEAQVCADLEYNVEHCGRCGHGCGDDEFCSVGWCSQSLWQSTESGGELELALDATYAYVTSASRGSVLRVNRATGIAETSASDQASPRQPVVGASNLYWVVGDTGEDTIMKLTTDESAPIALASEPNGVTAIAVNASHVYFTNGDSVLRVPVGGGDVEQLTDSSVTSAYDLVLDASYVYWLSGNSIMKVPLVGGEVETLLDNLNSPNLIAMHGDLLYVADSSQVSRVGKDGSDAASLIQLDWRATDLDVDESGIFVSGIFVADTYFLLRSSLDGASSETIAEDVYSVVLEPERVWWANRPPPRSADQPEGIYSTAKEQ